jgi:hypothetical protein
MFYGMHRFCIMSRFRENSLPFDFRVKYGLHGTKIKFVWQLSVYSSYFKFNRNPLSNVGDTACERRDRRTDIPPPYALISRTLCKEHKKKRFRHLMGANLGLRL